MELAPIAISTYSRINHLKQTIEALQKNTLAKESELYIFSDAPKKSDEEIVVRIRQYAHSVTGFKKVHVIERKKNGRINNNRGGMKQLLDKYGKCIFLEDDIVTAAGFLQFMNEALDYYENDNRIDFVSGYVIPRIKLKNYKSDCFLLGRFESWGFGMWKRSLKNFRYIPKKKYDLICNNKKELRKLLRRTGEDAEFLIKKDYNREMDGGDIKAWFWQFVNNTYTVYPKRTLVKNIGNDGSGVHMDVTTKWDNEDLWEQTTFHCQKNLQIERRTERMNYKFYKLSYRNRLRKIKFLRTLYNKFKKLGIRI